MTSPGTALEGDDDDAMCGLLARCADGDAQARDTLFAQLYPKLRRLAHSRLRGHRDASMLQTTALVHEAYLRVAGHATRARERAQFMAYAAQIMRSIIADAARARLAERRGGGALHLPWDTEQEERVADGAAEIVRVHEAVLALEDSDPRAARVVEMRWFAGYEEREIADVLGVTERTVQRSWAKARAILAEVLHD
jgi:RNA polymerase sigma factor (TIGR02999 family)